MFWPSTALLAVDVFLDPMQKLPLIQQSHIEVSILRELIACEEPQGADSVAEFHKDYVIPGLVEEICLVEIDPSVIGIPASRDLNPDRERRALCGVGRLEDVDEETAFGRRSAGSLRYGRYLGHAYAVRAVMRPLVCIQHEYIIHNGMPR